MKDVDVKLIINGTCVSDAVPPRTSLADFIRERAGYTGTHLGCEHGVCGSCNVLRGGKSIRSCLTLAVQANGSTIDTTEGIVEGSQKGRRIAEVLMETGGLQCGFCTPGFVVSIAEMLDAGERLDEDEIRTALSGNICRCTGYAPIVRAVSQLLDEFC